MHSICRPSLPHHYDVGLRPEMYYVHTSMQASVRIVCQGRLRVPFIDFLILVTAGALVLGRFFVNLSA